MHCVMLGNVFEELVVSELLELCGSSVVLRNEVETLSIKRCNSKSSPTFTHSKFLALH